LRDALKGIAAKISTRISLLRNRLLTGRKRR